MAERGGALELTASCLLIDSDGVLVDSAASIRRAFLKWSDSFGLNGDKIYDEFHGHRTTEVAAAVFEQYHIGEDVQSAAMLLDRLELEDAANVKALPGALELLDRLSGRWTLVSSGPRALVEARLKCAGLPFPRNSVTAEDVTEGKPDPECYIRAAGLNHASPASCIAFEDSATGLLAATRAGCQVVQVGTTSTRNPDLPFVTDLGAVEAMVSSQDVRVRLKAVR